MQSKDLEGNVTTFYDDLFKNDAHEELYEGTGFSNYGYWTPETKTPVQACENLVDRLLGPVPRHGAVLDVACGSGGTTALLAGCFDEVTAVNVSAYQVSRTKARVPGCRALRMDATRLAFRDASFDAVVCVEAVFHFRSKIRFFAEAFRVLKPGGWLVFSDVIFAAPRPSFMLRHLAKLPSTLFPLANELNLASYKDVLEVLGFAVTLSSTYTETWERFYSFHKDYCQKKVVDDPEHAEIYRRSLAVYHEINLVLCDYLLVAGQKPRPNTSSSTPAPSWAK